MHNRRSNPWKYLFPVALTCLDAGLTLLGQPAVYWRDYSQAMELAPHFSCLLKIHPLAFIGGVGAWILGYTLLIRFTPTWPSLVVSVMFILGHAFGATTWLLYQYGMNYFFLFVLFPLLAAVVIFVVRKEDWPDKTENSLDRNAAAHLPEADQDAVPNETRRT